MRMPHAMINSNASVTKDSKEMERNVNVRKNNILFGISPSLKDLL